MPKNHYLDPRIQKKLPKKPDNQVQFTGMKIRKHFVIIGGTGSGKSNILYDYILETSKGKGTFNHIYLCYKTEEPLYADLQEELEDGITCYKSLSDFPSVNEFPDAKTAEEKFEFLVVFDDCINDKSKEDVKKVAEYFTYGRKKGITIAYLSQSFYSIESFNRKQISYILMLTVKGKTDLRNILREYGSLDLTVDELYEIYKVATQKRSDDDMPFLKITCDVCPVDKKFSRDWIEYLTIDK